MRLLRDIGLLLIALVVLVFVMHLPKLIQLLIDAGRVMILIAILLFAVWLEKQRKGGD